MNALHTAAVLEDEEGPYIILPDGVGFGVDRDVVIDQIGEQFFITLKEDVAARHEYRVERGLPLGE